VPAVHWTNIDARWTRMNISEFVYTVVLKPKILKNATNWMNKHAVPGTVNIEGATIHLNPNDSVISGALALKVYEWDEIAFFRNY